MLRISVGSFLPAVLLALPASVSAQQPWPGRTRLEAERCTVASGRGAEWLERAARATGLGSLTGALRFAATESDAQAYQSDRMYPPFIASSIAAEFAFDPATGAERITTLVPGGGRGRELIRTLHATFLVRDTLLIPIAALHRFVEPQRPLNPLAILAEWRGSEVGVVARCTFRDHPRVVLSRGRGGPGQQRGVRNRIRLHSEASRAERSPRRRPAALPGYPPCPVVGQG